MAEGVRFVTMDTNAIHKSEVTKDGCLVRCTYCQSKNRLNIAALRLPQPTPHSPPNWLGGLRHRRRSIKVGTASGPEICSEGWSSPLDPCIESHTDGDANQHLPDTIDRPCPLLREVRHVLGRQRLQTVERHTRTYVAQCMVDIPGFPSVDSGRTHSTRLVQIARFHAENSGEVLIPAAGKCGLLPPNRRSSRESYASAAAD